MWREPAHAIIHTIYMVSFSGRCCSLKCNSVQPARKNTGVCLYSYHHQHSSTPALVFSTSSSRGSSSRSSTPTRSTWHTSTTITWKWKTMNSVYLGFEINSWENSSSFWRRLRSRPPGLRTNIFNYEPWGSLAISISLLKVCHIIRPAER